MACLPHEGLKAGAPLPVWLPHERHYAAVLDLKHPRSWPATALLCRPRHELLGSYEQQQYGTKSSCSREVGMCTDRPRQPDLGQINREGPKRLGWGMRPVITPWVLGIGALSGQALWTWLALMQMYWGNICRLYDPPMSCRRSTGDPQLNMHLTYALLTVKGDDPQRVEC